MQFQINRDVLLKSLAIAHSIIERKNTLPILSNVLLEIKKDKFNVIATDLDLVFIDEISDFKSDKDGSTTTSETVLYDILKKLPQNTEISFSLKNENKLSISADNSKFNLLCLPVDNFPTFNENFANEVMDEIKILLKKLDRKEIASESWKNYGVVIISKSIQSSILLANEIAPEHLELAIDNSTKYLDKIKNAGAVFLGKYTPEAIGDYIAGPNHVLPTDRTAKFSSGLNVLDFFKRTSVVSCNSENLKKIGKDAIILANQEGLQAHALSIECRIKN